MDKQKINSRIQKLQAIANDPGATSAEVESAKRLIARYKAVTPTPPNLQQASLDFQFRIYQSIKFRVFYPGEVVNITS